MLSPLGEDALPCSAVDEHRAHPWNVVERPRAELPHAPMDSPILASASPEAGKKCCHPIPQPLRVVGDAVRGEGRTGDRPTAASGQCPWSHQVGFAEKMTITRRKAPITAPRKLAKCQCKQRRVVPSRMLPVDSARVSERIRLLTLVEGRRKQLSAL
jgi:hypothetical protein